MNKYLSIFVFIMAITALIIAQERIDVIHLKNGDIAKGIIIENVPNDYIKIQMSNGSILTFKYSDIAKFTVEIDSTKQRDRELYFNRTYPYSDMMFTRGIDFRIGYFYPSDNAFKDIYGNGVSFEFGYFSSVEDRIGGEAYLSIFLKSGEPIEYDPYNEIESSDAKILIYTFPNADFFYKFKTGKFTSISIGAGVGYYWVLETVEMTLYDGDYISDDFSANGIGFHLFGSFYLGPGYVRFKYSFANVKGDGGSSLNVGGLHLMTGIAIRLW